MRCDLVKLLVLEVKNYEVPGYIGMALDAHNFLLDSEMDEFGATV